MTRKINVAVLVLVLGTIGLSLGSCGKKAALDEPPDSQYPRTYPSE